MATSYGIHRASLGTDYATDVINIDLYEPCSQVNLPQSRRSWLLPPQHRGGFYFSEELLYMILYKIS
jgi:hypothetical protein